MCISHRRQTLCSRRRCTNSPLAIFYAIFFTAMILPNSICEKELLAASLTKSTVRKRLCETYKARSWNHAHVRRRKCTRFEWFKRPALIVVDRELLGSIRGDRTFSFIFFSLRMRYCAYYQRHIHNRNA